MAYDDTTIISSGRNPTQALQVAEVVFGEARMWLETNKLQLNLGKTQRLLCSLAQHSPDHHSVSLLGFIIDPEIKWNCHIEELCKRLARVTECDLSTTEADTADPYQMLWGQCTNRP
ncbi:uncharacterized protein LOC120354369 [Nilaparvata lugens]|uniref:uncharacterized protein LOC120354369 n=1 Tax=Nilaparvata lugens TaxID=108931 RepID=UPI00193DD888|nr:uncharacterized protein LOC120354369 [Nilaparvata lugens]